jgi:16S rRNA (cytosine967-C5)-methyltransferase
MTSQQNAVMAPDVRSLAVSLFRACIERKITVEDAIGADTRTGQLSPRDRGLLATILLTAFRHLGEIEKVLAKLLDKPLPRKSGTAADILRLGIAQLLFLDMPPHAVIDLSVRAAKADRNALHFSGLVNAVLRKVSAGGISLLEGMDAARANTPDWLWARWAQNHGAGAARRVGMAHAARPALDLSFRPEAGADWRERLEGVLLPNGQVRLAAGHAPVPELPGFSEGAWWVQDAAATIPASLLGDVQGKRVLDLCAAPGGKTLQLAAAGAEVTAVDVSESRLQRLRQNLARTGLTAEIRTDDILAETLQGAWDAVLLDAPCSATGTIRRHPELPFLKDESQIAELAKLQARMLRKAATLVCPGGSLVYCTCSLEPEEGEEQVRGFLAASENFEIVPPAVSWIPVEAIMPEDWVRTLPFMRFGESEGMDGFFAVHLCRRV